MPHVICDYSYFPESIARDLGELLGMKPCEIVQINDDWPLHVEYLPNGRAFVVVPKDVVIQDAGELSRLLFTDVPAAPLPKSRRRTAATRSASTMRTRISGSPGLRRRPLRKSAEPSERH